MSKEELNHKLNKIFQVLADIRLDLDRLENRRKKEQAIERKKLAEQEIREIEYEEDNRWEYRSEMFDDFNRRFEEDVEEL